MITNNDYVSSWKSKGLSAESVKSPKTSGNIITPALSYYVTKTKVKFNGNCLQQPKVSYTHGIIVNIYIVYELSASSSHSDDPTLKDCLFDAVTLTKNADIDRYGYSGYGIEFDRKSIFSFPSSGFGQNVIIFEVDMTSSARVDLTAEKMYSIDFTVTKENFVSACITKAQIVTYLSMVHKFTNLKHSEIAAAPLCLGNISKDWSIDDMKKTGFN